MLPAVALFFFLLHVAKGFGKSNVEEAYFSFAATLDINFFFFFEVHLCAMHNISEPELSYLFIQPDQHTAQEKKNHAPHRPDV